MSTYQDLRDRCAYAGGIGIGENDPWMPAILELNDKLSMLDPDYKISQVKEKFGGLRFYATTSNNAVVEDFRNFIRYYESICQDDYS
jgi:hypothetical protein